MSRARKMWITTCVLWAFLWLVVGALIWPLLVMVPLSLLMLLLPVGVRR